MIRQTRILRGSGVQWQTLLYNFCAMTCTMMKPVLFALCVSLMLLSGGCDSCYSSRATPAVELTAEPSHHFALQNEYVRIFKVEVAPHASTLLHRHGHDYIFVTLGDADLTNAVADQPPAELKLKDGEVRFSAAPLVHRAINNGATPFRNVTVELLQPNRSYKPTEEDRGLEVGHGAMQETLFVQDGVKASDVTINPGQMLHRQTYLRPHLVVAVSALELESEPADGAARAIHAQPGDVEWVAAGVTQSLMNTGMKPGRFIMLEFE